MVRCSECCGSKNAKTKVSGRSVSGRSEGGRAIYIICTLLIIISLQVLKIFDYNFRSDKTLDNGTAFALVANEFPFTSLQLHRFTNAFSLY